jgi:uncharacterized membrane protein (UPF0182 family)
VTFERESRAPRPVVQRRQRGALIPTLVILGVLIVLGLLLAQIWTDVLWFGQLGYTSIYRTQILARAGLFLLGAVVMAAAVSSSLLVGYRGRPVYAPVSPEQAGLDRYRESVEPLRRIVGIAVPVVLGLFAGSAASQHWQTALLWLNRVPFNAKDPQFGMDAGFFVFTLPWLQFLVGFLTAATFLAAIAAVVTHYLYGGLRLQGTGPRLTQVARVHLCALAAVFLLLRGVDYWLGRFALATKDSRLITGLTYTDANAVLTARGVLAGISVIVAVLFIVAAVTERWRLIPLYGVALLVVSAIVVGGIYPAAVQRFQVTPSARSLEAEYIDRNIKATRVAYGLSDVDQTSFSATTEAEPGALRDSAETIPGIRLLDPALVSDTFRQLQQIKQYYSFPDSLDVDRYKIDGKIRDAVVAVRELDIDAAPTNQRNWFNDHLVYTHGFGVVGAYGNERGSDGKPVFFQQGIPSTGKLGAYEPRVYFGERSPEYSIVGAPKGEAPQELDFPDDQNADASGQKNNTYAGNGGIPIGSTFRQLLFALKFQQQNLLLSKGVNSDSRIMYDRSPRERVEKVAPFLTLDGDPYPAVVDGRIKWIVDGYTTTSHYPYSRTQVLEEATSDSITATTQSVVPLESQKINYIRNSVKATVDAFDGTVSLYTWDEQDPVLKAWKSVFGGIVKPRSEIDSELMAHLRYPEDLFKVQRHLLQNYHVTNAQAFFTTQDFWEVPADPTRGTNELQPPYYLTLQMPGQDATSFSLTSTFVPAGRTRNVLTGFLAVDADAGTTGGKPREGYGKIRLLQLPRDTVVPGPGQVQNNFNADPTVSAELNLLARGSSKVDRGNLLTLPLGGGLLYVQPVYVGSTGRGSYPLLQKVLVAFGDKIGFANTLDDALDQVFGAGSSSGSGSGGGAAPGSGDAGTPTQFDARVAAALRDAAKALKDSDAALKAGDFAAYGTAQKRLQAAVQAATDAQRQAAAARVAGGAASASASPSATPKASPSPSP